MKSKVYESSKKYMACQNSDRCLNLVIDGPGMFVVRSALPLNTQSAGASTEFYYTRNGKFKIDRYARLVDDFGGILQAESSLPFSKTPIDINLSKYNISFSTTYVSCSAQGYICFNSKCTYRHYPTEVSRFQVKIIPILNNPRQAQYISGTELAGCWNGDVFEYKKYIRPEILQNGFEQLCEDYDLSHTGSKAKESRCAFLGWCYAQDDSDDPNDYNKIVDAIPFDLENAVQISAPRYTP